MGELFPSAGGLTASIHRAVSRPDSRTHESGENADMGEYPYGERTPSSRNRLRVRSIHSTSGNRCSANFVLTEFSEVRLDYFVAGSDKRRFSEA